ncbi:MAG TPA: S41 family peptidase [Candidatus Kapabacteria bacterium]|nr:S41 family peptidase [Candidatus Kapabacteria bacterium]
MQNEPMTTKTKRWILLGFASILFSFGLGLVIGKAWDIHGDVLNASGSVDIVKVMNLYSKTRSSEVDFDQFWRVWDRVKEKYVDQPVNDVDLFYGAIQGLVQGLDDPYSVYFPPTKAEEFTKDLAGEFEGIGAEIGLKADQLTVIAPLPSSPAEKAGLKPGDKIFTIDKKETFGLSLEEAIALIRGKKGTPVVLTVSGNGVEEAREVSIIRDTINVPTVISSMKEGNIGYIRIGYFNENTGRDFNKAVTDLLLKSPKGFILDLRSNPGGYLETSVDVASEWITSGPIVKELLQGGVKQQHDTRGTHRLAGKKTVVLVDAGTASGSEIVAGALQDHGAAILVGEKTYGKGSVQDFEILPDGSALKLTIAKWLTPKDRHIDKQGIMPDIVLEQMFEEDASQTGETSVRDLGLEKALSLIKGT